MHQLELQYQRSQFVHVDWHIAGLLDAGPEADALWNYYNLSGAPAVLFDGYDLQLGGGQNMYPVYAPIVANHLANDLSKLTVAATLIVGSSGAVHADVTVAPGETITNPSECRIRCVVYEDNIVLCCDPRGNDDWNGIARDGLPDVVLTATNPGDVQTYDQVFTISGGWNPANLRAIVYVQRLTNKRILNAGYAYHDDYGLTLSTLDPVTQRVEGAAVPVEWDQQITYTGVTTDDVEVSIDESALPVGWDAELVYNSTTYPSSFTIPAMTTGQQADFLVRTIPGTNPGLGVAELQVAPVSQPAAAWFVDLNVIWNIPAILLVDDDNGAAHEVAFKSAINDAGYAAVTHPVSTLGVPPLSTLNIFDAVVWTTGELETDTIDFAAETDLRAYLDQGGNLFLSSQGFLDERGQNTLTINYFRLKNPIVLDQGATVGNGLAGDLIGDGLALALAPPYPDKADVFTPNTGGIGWLKNQLASTIGIRYDSGVYKTVFMAAPFEGIPLLATAADPNNQKTVMKRILDWFIPTSTDVTPGTGTATTKISLAQNAPNPFSATTSMSFVLPKAGPVSLLVYDVSGRLVSTLIDRPMDSGTHQVNWDGRDSGGNSVANGVYLVRLQAGGETLTRDMVRMK